MRRAVIPALVLGLSPFLSGCVAPVPSSPPAISSVTPSKSGTPNSVAVFGHFEFVSVQGTGQIFTYDISSGLQVLVGTYATPCNDPSGMVIATISSKNVMAVACYDTGSLLTLNLNTDGSMSPLGAIGGLPMPFPGTALDGTTVLVPLFGGSSSNGAIAKVNIASPASPTLLATVTLASPVTGGVANAEYLALASGYIYVTSGSESNPLGSSSTIQVVNESTMALVGTPLVVPHSPQQIAVQGTVAYVTLYDATALESIDISNPAALKPLQTLPLTVAGKNCSSLPVTVQGTVVYVGCYAEGALDRLDVTNPALMQPLSSISGVPFPQRLAANGSLLFVTSSSTGGSVYQLNLEKY